MQCVNGPRKSHPPGSAGFREAASKSQSKSTGVTCMHEKLRALWCNCPSEVFPVPSDRDGRQHSIAGPAAQEGLLMGSGGRTRSDGFASRFPSA
eukprot:15340687-Alexandrium_andersonii.AAC.1